MVIWVQRSTEKEGRRDVRNLVHAAAGRRVGAESFKSRHHDNVRRIEPPASTEMKLKLLSSSEFGPIMLSHRNISEPGKQLVFISLEN